MAQASLKKFFALLMNVGSEKLKGKFIQMVARFLRGMEMVFKKIAPWVSLRDKDCSKETSP